MSDPETTGEVESDSGADSPRLHLLWDVLLFQFKLAADGLRDILLSPLSIFSALFGLISGGDDPYRYFKQVLKFGRRTEIWINLFGYRKHSGTSDAMITPLREKVFAEARNRPWMSNAGREIGRKLDDVNSGLNRRNTPPPPGESD